MKKREITNIDLEQLFDRIIEQKPLINEEQVISILDQLPKAKPGNAVKRFFQNHLNTLILGVLVLSIAATMIWVFSRPKTETITIQNNPPQENKVDQVPTDTFVVHSSAEMGQDRIQDTVREDIIISTTEVSSRPVQADTFGSVSTIFKHFDQQAQLFSIEPGRDTLIICKEGTSIRIKAHSFVSEKTGRVVSGKVKLEVKEYYKLSDMLLSNLTTTSGGEILETGGMLHITATSDQEKCLIQQGSEIEIGFPFASKKEDMELFNGEWKNELIDWKLVNMVEDIVISTAEVIGMDVAEPFTMVEQMPEFPGGEGALKKYMGKNIQYPFSAIKDKIDGMVYVNFIVENDGTFTNVRVVKSLDSTLDKVAVYVVENMPKWVPGRQNGQAVNCIYTLPVRFAAKNGVLTNEEILQSKVLEEKIKKVKVNYHDYTTKEEFKEEFEKKVKEDNFQETSVADVNRYIFSVSQFGWINCDRFVYDKRTNYAIRIDQPGKVVAKVVFHRYNAILPGSVEADRISFKNVPLGEKITILALKRMNDKIFLAVKETIVTDKVETGLDFQEVTMDLLKQEMEKLNKLN